MTKGLNTYLTCFKIKWVEYLNLEGSLLQNSKWLKTPNAFRLQLSFQFIETEEALNPLKIPSNGIVKAVLYLFQLMDLDMPESAFHVKLAKNDYLTKLVNQVFLVNQAYVYNVSCAHAQCVSMYD